MKERQTGFSWTEILDAVKRRLVEIVEDPRTSSRDMWGIVSALNCVSKIEQRRGV